MDGAAGEPRGLVLVVDDDAEVRDLVAEVLTLSGYRVLTAGDGEQALALALEHRPALVLLDVMMPGMDGYAALTGLRSDPATREIPVVVLTAQEEPVLRTLSLGAGAVAHLTKPFSADGLTALVERLLAGRRGP